MRSFVSTTRLQAVTGGFLGPNHLKMLEERVNKNLREKQFAIWRIEEPWLPRTKKSQGARLGGGKGRIKRYVTPVRAGRIILEVGGYIIEPEVNSFPFYPIPYIPSLNLGSLVFVLPRRSVADESGIR